MLPGSGAVPPRAEVFSSDERLAELAEILAAGLMRVVTRKSSQTCGHSGESSLDFSAPESGHPTPVDRRPSDG